MDHHIDPSARSRSQRQVLLQLERALRYPSAGPGNGAHRPVTDPALVVTARAFADAVERLGSCLDTSASLTLRLAGDVVQARLDLFDTLTGLGWTPSPELRGQIGRDTALMTLLEGAVGG